MARIRSIHPNTPTDPDLAALPIEARLLFIYSWTIADDAGNLERSPRGMKMALFPGDDKLTIGKIGKLVDLLVAGRFYEAYEGDGKAFLHIRNFEKYQKPDHPTPPRFPLSPGQSYTYHVRDGNSWKQKTVGPENSPNAPGTLPERTGNVLAGREGKGEEGKGTEGARGHDAPADALEASRAAATDKGNGKDNTPDVFSHLPAEVREKLNHLPLFQQTAVVQALKSIEEGARPEDARKTLLTVWSQIPRAIVDALLPEEATCK